MSSQVSFSPSQHRMFSLDVFSTIANDPYDFRFLVGVLDAPAEEFQVLHLPVNSH